MKPLIKFNLASPKQLGEFYLKTKIGGAKQKKNKTVNMQQVKKSCYLANDPIVKRYFELAPINKTSKHYVEALPNQVDAITGRIHTDYMQTVAATGRLSSIIQICKISYSNRKRETNKKSICCKRRKLYFSADYSQMNCVSLQP
jgi:DNA polymerase-1